MRIGGSIAVAQSVSAVEWLTAALRRLASVEPFTTSLEPGAELAARIEYARSFVDPEASQLDSELLTVVREALAEQAAADRLINR